MEFKEKLLNDILEINPKISLKKGVVAKKIAMEHLHENFKHIQGFELTEFKSGSKFKNQDTLVARITPCLENGKTAYVNLLEESEIAFGSTEFFVIRAKEGKGDPQFIYYLMRHPKIREAIIKSMTGTSGRQRAHKEAILNYSMYLPNLNTQKKIGNFLSLFDSKIEANKEIVRNLEKLSQTLFKQWFIDFEFPNEEGQPYKTSGGELVESELGKIPKGWKVEFLHEYVDFLSGGTPKTTIQEYWNGSIPFFTPKDAKSNLYTTVTEKTITELGLEKCNSKLYPKNTLFITARGTVGKLALANKAMAMNQSCFALKHKEHKQFYLYHVVENLVKKIILGANGAVFSAINLNDLKNLNYVYSNESLISKFETTVSNFYDQMSLLEKENIKLQQIRDSLLPKLLSGEIKISNELEV